MVENFAFSVSLHEGLTLAAGFKTIGDLKVYFIERLRRHVFDAEKRQQDEFAGSGLGAGTNQNLF